MNEPIVSPAAVYLIGICDSVVIVAGILAAIIGAAAGIMLFAILLDTANNILAPGETAAKRTAQKMLIVAAVFALIAVLVPSRNTAIAMIAAKNITPETLRMSGQTAQQCAEAIVKTIFEAIRE